MVWPWIIAALACQEPFGTDRHDLEGFRIAAVTAPVTSEGTRPRAILVTDGQLWSDTAVTLEWYEAHDPAALSPDALAALGSPLATGPAPTLPDELDGLGLVATWPDGLQRTAWLSGVDDGVRIDSVRLSVVDDAELGTITGPELSVDARQTWTTTEADFVPAGGIARLIAAVDDPARPPLVRWMATREHGSFFELDRTTTDWTTGRILVDDEEIESLEPSEPGVSSLLALAVSDRGATAYTIRELWIGEPSSGIVTASGRWLATDAAVEGRYLSGVLEADDAAPTGVALTGVVEAFPAIGKPDPWQTEALGCTDVAGPFDPSWLADGRCTRQAVLGATVVVEQR